MQVFVGEFLPAGKVKRCVYVETCNMSISPPAVTHLILAARGKYKYDGSMLHHSSTRVFT